jgi:hypothetical protein
MAKVFCLGHTTEKKGARRLSRAPGVTLQTRLLTDEAERAGTPWYRLRAEAAILKLFRCKAVFRDTLWTNASALQNR